MTTYTWLFSDTAEYLPINGRAYLVMPDNTYVYEHKYKGEGYFDERNVFGFLAEWNRDFLSAHPDFMIGKRRIDSYKWYTLYSSQIPRREVERRYKSKYQLRYFSFEAIGQVIARSNEFLEYPVKICRNPGKRYAELPVSKNYRIPKNGKKNTKKRFSINLNMI